MFEDVWSDGKRMSMRCSGIPHEKREKQIENGLYLHTPTVVPLDVPLFSLSAWFALALSSSSRLQQRVSSPHTTHISQTHHIPFCCRSETRILENCLFGFLFWVCDAPDEHHNNHHYRQIERTALTHFRHTFEFRTSFSNTICARSLGTRRTHVHTKSFFLLFFLLLRIIIGFAGRKGFGIASK